MSRPGEIPSRPYKVAAWPRRPSSLSEMCGQNESSVLRVMPRYKMIPHSCFLPAGKRRLLNGMDIEDDKAAAGNFSVRIPDSVERSVEVCAGFFFARGLGPDRVPLHAERRGLEGIGAAAIMKGVEHDLDLIVVEDVFAARHASADFAGIIEAHEDDVEILLVIAEVGIGGLGDGLAIVRIALGEAGNLRHLQSDFALRLHRQEVIERRAVLEAGDRESRERSRGLTGVGLGRGPESRGMPQRPALSLARYEPLHSPSTQNYAAASDALIPRRPGGGLSKIYQPCGLQNN